MEDGNCPPPLVSAGGAGWRGDLAAYADGKVHAYLSTACLHGRHDECGTLQHESGDDGPAHCKFCPSVCLCPVCGHQPAATGRARRAFYRSYPADGYRASSVTRLHVVKEPGDWLRARAGGPGRSLYGLCGTAAGIHTNSRPVFLDPMPATPPAGLSWCPPCLGHLADRIGAADLVGALLSAVNA